MEIRVRATGAVMFENEFRAYVKANDGPTWEQTTPEILDSLGADPVFEGPQATITTPYQFSMRNGTEQIDGKWYTKYIAGPVFINYTDEHGIIHTTHEQELAYRAKKDLERANSIRILRNEKLKESDWTQGKDIPDSISAPWATYRQMLRDITSQSGFPWSVVWPAEPV